MKVSSVLVEKDNSGILFLETSRTDQDFREINTRSIEKVNTKVRCFW